MKKLFILLAVLAIAAVAGYFYTQQQNQKAVAAINPFDDCVAAGFPVMESYPPQCRTSDGKSFTQDIGNALFYADEIVVDNPRPNQIVSSPLKVTGKARGTWFFEADFPVELVDGDGKSLGVGHAQAQGEWMTEEFVPFEGKIIFEKPTTTNGTLIIRNANPSGLPENEKEVKIPVEF